MKRKSEMSLEERFWEKVDIKSDDECWNWNACKTYGYGHFNGDKNGKLVNERRAHRISYTLSNGPIPTGLMVLHSCDNPSCVNPNHLSVGTHQENMDQMMERKRWRPGNRSNCGRPKSPLSWKKRNYKPLNAVYEYHILDKITGKTFVVHNLLNWLKMKGLIHLRSRLVSDGCCKNIVILSKTRLRKE